MRTLTCFLLVVVYILLISAVSVRSCSFTQKSIQELTTSLQELISDQKKVVQYQIYEQKKKDPVHTFYMTKTPKFLLVEPEARFYTLGYIFYTFSFKRLDLSESCKLGSSSNDFMNNLNTIMPVAQLAGGEVSQFSTVNYCETYEAEGALLNQKLPLFSLELKGIQCIANVSGTAKSTVIRGNFTKQIVQAFFILFIIIITVTWMNSNCFQFVQESKKRPYYYSYMTDDLADGFRDIWLMNLADKLHPVITFCSNAYAWFSFEPINTLKYNEIIQKEAVHSMSQNPYIVMKSMIVLLIGLAILVVSFFRSFVPKKWPGSNYVEASIMQTRSLLDQNLVFSLGYCIVWIVIVFWLLTGIIYNAMLPVSKYVELTSIKARSKRKTNLLYAVSTLTLKLVASAMMVVFVQFFLNWAVLIRVLFSISVVVFIFYSMFHSTWVPVGLCEDILCFKAEFYARIAASLVFKFITMTAALFLSFFLGDVLFSLIWFNIHNVVLYQERITWVAFAGLLLLTVKNLWNDASALYMITKRALTTSAPRILLPRLSPKLSYSQTHFVASEYFQMEPYETVLQNAFRSKLDETKRILQALINPQSIQTPTQEISTPTRVILDERITEILPEEIELGYEELRDITDVITKPTEMEYLKMKYIPTKSIRIRPVFHRHGQHYTPLSIRHFLAIHRLVIGRSAIAERVFFRLILVAVTSSVLFLAFSSLSLSPDVTADSNQNFLSYILAVATVFLPSFLSQLKIDEIEKDFETRIRPALQLYKKQLTKGQESKEFLDKLHLCALHVTSQDCNVASYMREQGVIDAPWIFPAPLRPDLMKRFRKSWDRCSRSQNLRLGFIYLRDDKIEYFLQETFQIILCELQENYDSKSIYFSPILRDFWIKILDMNGDRIVNYGELISLIIILIDKIYPGDQKICILTFQYLMRSGAKERCLTYDDIAGHVHLPTILSTSFRHFIHEAQVPPCYPSLEYMLERADIALQQLETLDCLRGIELDIGSFQLLFIGLMRHDLVQQEALRYPHLNQVPQPTTMSRQSIHTDMKGIEADEEEPSILVVDE